MPLYPIINRLGESRLNTHGNHMTIIEYNKYEDILVQFEDGYITRSSYRNFKSGKISSPYDKTIYNIGYIGIGKYKTQGRDYVCWHNMIKRCYNKECQEKQPSYKNCIVADEWHNFQNFAKWWEENYYRVENEVMALDKDILYKNNNVYSPKCCLIVPEKINNLFVRHPSTKYNLPAGVSYTNNTGVNGGKKYVGTYAYTIDNKKVYYHKTFHTIKEAFEFYKKYKEKYIKEIANKYKNKIPKIIYETLINYKIEICD